jgi:hypothetical protein
VVSQIAVCWAGGLVCSGYQHHRMVAMVVQRRAPVRHRASMCFQATLEMNHLQVQKWGIGMSTWNQTVR